MSSQSVIKALNTVLADTYSLTVKTHNYHWNVEGASFPTLHSLFESHYNELFKATDVIAERIRALGSKVNGTLNAFAKLSSIKEADYELSAEQMLSDLCASHQAALATIDKAIETCDKAKDAASADLLTQRQAAHEKIVWMLKACMPQPARMKKAA